LKEDLAVPLSEIVRRGGILFEALGLGLRQVDRHPDREQRRRDHEDDEQHHMTSTMGVTLISLMTARRLR